ncbi:MAG: hypothetical protein IKR12_02850, partial [Clostridia bacterium]|nr:hypothetical protein [Clostridia bacterium]
SKDLQYSSEIELFNLTKRHSAGQKISYAQFVACLYTFLELGTVKSKKDSNWSLSLNESQKTNLENSSFYNKLYFLSRIL